MVNKGKFAIVRHRTSEKTCVEVEYPECFAVIPLTDIPLDLPVPISLRIQALLFFSVISLNITSIFYTFSWQNKGSPHLKQTFWGLKTD